MSYEYLKLKELVGTITGMVKEEAAKFTTTVKIASMILGDDPASLSYLRGMKKRAVKLGLEVDIIQLPKDMPEDDFIAEITAINDNDAYAGLIIQVPLPRHINQHRVAMTIDYRKDIDGIHPLNLGLLFAGKSFLVPATAWAVDVTLDFLAEKYDFSLTGKNAVIVGRSLTVGRPLYHLLLQKNITPTSIHTRTVDPANISVRADIVIAACGACKLINEDWVKEGAYVIDVGIHSLDADNDKGYELCGDVDKASVDKKARLLTAVPGGIGSVTSVLVFANAVKSYYKIHNNSDFKFDFEK